MQSVPFDNWSLRAPDDVLVVVDAKNEVGFWRGGRYVVGDIEPNALVEVLS